jgi:8-oxo-dGTP pyrophosphatase MutT (NUDIX family)
MERVPFLTYFNMSFFGVGLCLSRVGACVLVVNNDGQVLLTRRTSTMRTFPNAWVLPGGSVDPGEDLATCAVRELQEETGVLIDPATLVPLCLWESFYPTSPEACIAAGRIAAQFLVVFFVGHVLGASPPAVVLQPAEADAYLWLAPEALLASTAGADDAGVVHEPLDTTLAVVHATGDIGSLPLSTICKIYHSQTQTGCAEGHYFALTLFASQFVRSRM